MLTGASGCSFPSGHATGFTALVVAAVGVILVLVLDRATDCFGGWALATLP